MRYVAAVIALVATAGPAPAQEPNLRDVSAEAAGRAAARWNVPANLRFTEGGEVRWFPDRIDVGLTGLRRLTAGMPDDTARIVVGWLLAHEVWHERQHRRDGGLELLDRAHSRLRECEADVMAAHATADIEFSSRRLRSNESAAQRLGSAIASVVATAQALEVGAGADGDHPTGAQRRTAIRFGVGRALTERYLELTTESDRGLVRDRLSRAFDVSSGEAAPAWAVRTCRSILHAGDGAGLLAVGDPVVHWNTSADTPFVEYRIPYRNIGNATIRAELHVRTFAVPRDAPDDADQWRTADTHRHNFDLAPGQTYQLTGRLQWVATDALMPKIIFPTNRESLYQIATLRGGAAAQVHAPVQLVDGGPELSALRAVLSVLLASAADNFAGVETNCTPERGERSCELSIPFPGIKEASVEHAGNGASDVTVWVYRGGSASEADAAYSLMRGRLRALYPSAAFSERTSGDRRSVDLQPTPEAKIIVSRFSSGSAHRVLAVIEPTLAD